MEQIMRAMVAGRGITISVRGVEIVEHSGEAIDEDRARARGIIPLLRLLDDTQQLEFVWTVFATETPKFIS